MTHEEKIQALAVLIEQHTKEKYNRQYPNITERQGAWNVNVVPGKKYTKVDVGNSGKYMIDEAGNIYGIKAYGVIHRGHWYGTLDTINEYWWGEYTAVKIPKVA